MSDQAKILVVDDVPTNVRLLEAVLVSQGYDVVSANDGESALEVVASAKPDLVLLDVMMPPPDGYEVCRRFRENQETAVLPVVMVTASTTRRRRRSRSGADDLIAKPFDHDELLARVRSLLRIKRYHDTIATQSAELLDLNRTLEERVAGPGPGAGAGPEAAAVPLAAARRRDRLVGDESILRSHRRNVAMLFADLRGWTNFVDAVEPEELMQVLRSSTDGRRTGAAVRRDRGVPRGRRGPALLQ